MEGYIEIIPVGESSTRIFIEKSKIVFFTIDPAIYSNRKQYCITAHIEGGNSLSIKKNRNSDSFNSQKEAKEFLEGLMAEDQLDKKIKRLI